MLNFCDFIQVYVFTTNHHLKVKFDENNSSVTVDEIWVHYYEPENTAHGRQWVGPGSLRLKEVQYTSICWQGDGHSILFGMQKVLLCWTFYPREVQ